MGDPRGLSSFFVGDREERGGNFVAAAIARFILGAHARHRCTRKTQQSLNSSLPLSHTFSPCLSPSRLLVPLSSVLYLYCVPSLCRDSPGSRTVITGASKGLLLASTDSFVGIQRGPSICERVPPPNRHAKLRKKLGFERGAENDGTGENGETTKSARVVARRNWSDNSYNRIRPFAVYQQPDWLQKPRLLSLDINDIFSLPKVYINLCKSRPLSLSLFLSRRI